MSEYVENYESYLFLLLGKEFVSIGREKERKTPEVLEWNWRNQYELMVFFFNILIYINR